VLPDVREKWPQLQLYLHEDLTQRLYEKLMSGELDLILIALPYQLRNVEVMPLFDDPFRLAAHEHTRLIDPGHYRVEALPEAFRSLACEPVAAAVQ